MSCCCHAGWDYEYIGGVVLREDVPMRIRTMKIHAIGQIGSSAAERELMHLGSYLTVRYF